MIDNVISTEHFHPELAQHVISEGNGGLVYPNDKRYESYLSRCERIKTDLDLQLNDDYDRDYSDEEIELAIIEAERRYDTLHSHTSNTNLDQDDNIALNALKEYPLDAVEDSYIECVFGRLPNNSLAKLLLHADERFVFTVLHRNRQYAWIAYVGMKGDQKVLSDLFDSLYFEPIAIPIVTEEILNHDCYLLLDHIYGYVKKQANKESYLKYISLFGEQVVLTGFIASDDCDQFKQRFSEHVIVQDFPADFEPGLLAPTKLKNNWFSAPFSLFVEMYGLPKYGRFDPTTFFAITYSLLFGIMFADLGQGIVLVLGGYYLQRKKNMPLGGVAVRIGFSSMIFGTLFGSFFGNEEILLPLLENYGLPIHVASSSFTMTLLLSAVALGVILILTSIALNIVLSLKHKEYDKALLSQNGLSGFVLYAYVMVGLALNMGLGISIFATWSLILFVGVPLMVILLHQPLHNLMRKRALRPDAGWGAYLTEGIFELIEVILSFVTNTMSFLRVGGFVLSHAGMMIVVMTLTEMSGSYGIVVMIIGNALVIALEGLIVGIQTLRLEYYEMFSRYYEGGGKKFIAVY